MALKKPIETPYGIAAGYWNIGMYAEDYRNKAARVTLFGYLNQAAREMGSQPMGNAQVEIGGDQYAADMPREAVYAALKRLPAWKDAEDC